MNSRLLTRFKFAAAALLAVTLFLPQYTCARLRGPDGFVTDSIPAGADSSAYHVYNQPHYALENFGPTRIETWITVTAFSWPLLFLAIGYRRRLPRTSRVLWWLEPLLICVSGYLIILFSEVGDRAYGAYAALVALLALLGTWGFEVWVWIRKRRAPPAPVAP